MKDDLAVQVQIDEGVAQAERADVVGVIVGGDRLAKDGAPVEFRNSSVPRKPSITCARVTPPLEITPAQ